MAADTQVFGLENFGNTCYCNSVIQALYHTKPFRDYILGLAPRDRPRRRITPGDKPHPMVTEMQTYQQQAQNVKQADSPTQRTGGLSALRSRFSKSGNAASASAAAAAAHHENSASSAAASVSSLNSTFGSYTGSNSQSEALSQPTAALGCSEVGSRPIVGFLDDSGAGGLGGAGAGGPLSPGSAGSPSSPPLSSSFNSNTSYGLAPPNVSTLSTATSSQGESDSLIDIRKKNALLRGPIANVDHSFSKEYGEEETLVTALKDLFESIAENESATGVASPSRLVEVLKGENDLFRSSMHQDAQEFFNFLLNRVIEEEDKAAAKNGGARPAQPIKPLFAGELTNEMRCLFCETVTRRNEPFYDFSLETQPNTSVYHCIQQFCGSEVLGGNNKFYCDVCGGHQEALKRMKVRKAPPILVLHLKRFKFSEDEQRNTKLLHRVLYSKYLRLPITTDDCSTPEKLYELTSVIVHLGGGPYQGHYVVVTHTPRGWLLYDDEIVDYVDESFVFRFFGDRASLSTAYLLIYQEVSELDHERTNIEVQNVPILNPNCIEVSSS